MKKLTIVARYNEDISWTRELESDVLVYNKGNDWPWDDIPRIDITNYGREAETYARAIVECFQLIDDYDCVIFVQGNPFDHDDDPVESINEYNSDQIFYLANAMVTYNLPEERKYFDFEVATICKLFRKEFNPPGTFTKLDGQLAENEDRGSEILTSVFFAQLLGLDLSSRKIIYPAGAQYIVPVSYIKSKNYEWWFEFFTLISDWNYINPGDSIAAYCERIWLAIWNHKGHFDQKNPVP